MDHRQGLDGGMVMDLRNMEIRIGREEMRVPCRMDSKGNMRLELRQRRKEDI